MWGRRGSDFASCREGHPQAPSFLTTWFPLAGTQGKPLRPRGQQPPDTHREFFHISFQNSFQVELFQFPLQPWRQPRVHGGPSRQHNVLVEFRPDPKKNPVFVVLYSLLCTTTDTCTDRGVNTNLKNYYYCTKIDCTISGDLLILSQKEEIKKYCAFKIFSLLILTEIASRQPVKLQKLSLSPPPSIYPSPQYILSSHTVSKAKVFTMKTVLASPLHPDQGF